MSTPCAQSYLQPSAVDEGIAASRILTLEEIINDPVELEHFKVGAHRAHQLNNHQSFLKVFLNKQSAAMDLMCWMEIEAFRAIPSTYQSMRKLKARQLRKKYLNKNYFFGHNSPANKEAQRVTIQAGEHGSRLPARPRTPVFREVQRHARNRLEKFWIPKYMNSPEYLHWRKGTVAGVKSSMTLGHDASVSQLHFRVNINDSKICFSQPSGGTCGVRFS